MALGQQQRLLYQSAPHRTGQAEVASRKESVGTQEEESSRSFNSGRLWMSVRKLVLVASSEHVS